MSTVRTWTAMTARILDLKERLMNEHVTLVVTEATSDYCPVYLHRIDGHTADISDLSARIEEAMEPFRLARELLVSIPGFSTTVAEIFIAETGANVTVFRMPEQLAPWGGTSPGADESAGRVKSAKTRPGNRYLKGALGITALSAVRSNGTYFQAKYRRIPSRRGSVKAHVAGEHAMLTAAWHMVTTGELYRDPGADYFTRCTPAKTRARAIGQLEALGYQVTLEPLPPGRIGHLTASRNQANHPGPGAHHSFSCQSWVQFPSLMTLLCLHFGVRLFASWVRTTAEQLRPES